MQIKNTETVIDSTPGASGKRTSLTGFNETFDACLKTADQVRSITDSGNSGRKGAKTGTALEKLGTISPAAPTVSHLLIRHPVYGKNCWKIIHSEINHGKPYTRIPAGTTIYIDPETREIAWDVSGTDLSAPSGGQQECNSVAQRKTPVGDARERFLIDLAVSMAAEAHDLPRELIHSVIKAESGFQVHAVSPAGAQGLMQLMPETARELGVENPFDIRQNIDGGARYLKKMLDLFDGDIEKALAAYNAGPGAVKRHHGRIPYRETRLYVQRVLSFLDTNAES